MRDTQQQLCYSHKEPREASRVQPLTRLTNVLIDLQLDEPTNHFNILLFNFGVRAMNAPFASRQGR
ncbi:MAG TPA: hypothetical protein VN787_07640 [Steroidobacteraceae bacterium]|nr:hypothetical protein [Steroidobacteraceae bacterium]